MNSQKMPITELKDLVTYLEGNRGYPDREAIKSCAVIFGDCHDKHNSYGLPKDESVRALNAKVRLEASDLVEAAELCGSYNKFSPKIIWKILYELLSDRQGEIDPTRLRSDLKDFTFEFGREGSPVLYIRSRHRFWMEDLKALEKVSRADEFSMEADGSLRIWWD
jgi:hypothetical protein